MNKKYLLTMLFLLSSCSNTSTSISEESSSSTSFFNPYTYIKESAYNELKEKINNKDDFIFTITFSNCRWCQQQENDLFNYMKVSPVDIYVYELDTMFMHLEEDNNNVPLYGVDAYNAAKEEYRFFASSIEKIGDFILQEEGAYVKDNFTERFGEKEPCLIYPSTFIYIDGELVIEFSYIGYGWTETEDSFRSFVNTFNNLVKFK